MVYYSMLTLGLAAVLASCGVSLALPVGKNDLPALMQQIYIGQIERTNKTREILETPVYTRSTVAFPCSGLTCGAWLYKPKRSIDGSSRPPVIVMAHGLGGEKPFLDRYAVPLAREGFAVFSLDYRYWGESDGEPRRYISPPQQVEDWLSAVKYVQTNLNSVVDTSRLSLWGTSFAGGHVITVAAKLGSQIKSVVSQVCHNSSQTPLRLQCTVCDSSNSIPE